MYLQFLEKSQKCQGNYLFLDHTTKHFGFISLLSSLLYILIIQSLLILKSSLNKKPKQKNILLHFQNLLYFGGFTFFGRFFAVYKIKNLEMNEQSDVMDSFKMKNLPKEEKKLKQNFKQLYWNSEISEFIVQ